MYITSYSAFPSSSARLSPLKMSGENSTETAPNQEGERTTTGPPELGPLPQETRRRSTQPGIIRQDALHGMINYSECSFSYSISLYRS